MPPPNKPAEVKPLDQPPAEVKPLDQPPAEVKPPDQTAEVKRLTIALEAMQKSQAKTTLTIRTLAAAILTPPSEDDKGVGRKGAIREQMLKLVDVLTLE